MVDKLNCQKCTSNRIVFLTSHGKDMNSISAPHVKFKHDGYLPEIPNVGSGDDVDIEFCLECGQIQGTWPVSDDVLTSAEDDDDDNYVPPSSIQRDQNQLNYLSTLPDSAQKINLSKQFYDLAAVLDPNTLKMEDAFKDKLKLWLIENRDCYTFDETNGDWGSLTFYKPVNAGRFVQYFDLTWMYAAL